MILCSKGMNRGFTFTQIKKGRKSTLFEVKSGHSGTVFYHVVPNTSKKYPESEWPETIFDKETIKINDL